MRTEAETWEWVRGRAVYLAIESTPAERAILEDMQALGFRFQYPVRLVGPRGRVKFEIFDFFHFDLQLAVEVDGSSHRRKKGSDSRRDRMAAYNNIKTIRVSNKQALNGSALAKIKEAME